MRPGRQDPLFLWYLIPAGVPAIGETDRAGRCLETGAIREKWSDFPNRAAAAAQGVDRSARPRRNNSTIAETARTVAQPEFRPD